MTFVREAVPNRVDEPFRAAVSSSSSTTMNVRKRQQQRLPHLVLCPRGRQTMNDDGWRCRNPAAPVRNLPIDSVNSSYPDDDDDDDDDECDDAGRTGAGGVAACRTDVTGRASSTPDAGRRRGSSSTEADEYGFGRRGAAAAVSDGCSRCDGGGASGARVSRRIDRRRVVADRSRGKGRGRCGGTTTATYALFTLCLAGFLVMSTSPVACSDIRNSSAKLENSSWLSPDINYPVGKGDDDLEKFTFSSSPMPDGGSDRRTEDSSISLPADAVWISLAAETQASLPVPRMTENEKFLQKAEIDGNEEQNVTPKNCSKAVDEQKDGRRKRSVVGSGEKAQQQAQETERFGKVLINGEQIRTKSPASIHLPTVFPFTDIMGSRHLQQLEKSNKFPERNNLSLNRRSPPVIRKYVMASASPTLRQNEVTTATSSKIVNEWEGPSHLDFPQRRRPSEIRNYEFKEDLLHMDQSAKTPKRDHQLAQKRTDHGTRSIPSEPTDFPQILEADGEKGRGSIENLKNVYFDQNRLDKFHQSGTSQQIVQVSAPAYNDPTQTADFGSDASKIAFKNKPNSKPRQYFVNNFQSRMGRISSASLEADEEIRKFDEINWGLKEGYIQNNHHITDYRQFKSTTHQQGKEHVMTSKNSDRSFENEAVVSSYLDPLNNNFDRAEQYAEQKIATLRPPPATQKRPFGMSDLSPFSWPSTKVPPTTYRPAASFQLSSLPITLKPPLPAGTSSYAKEKNRVEPATSKPEQVSSFRDGRQRKVLVGRRKIGAPTKNASEIATFGRGEKSSRDFKPKWPLPPPTPSRPSTPPPQQFSQKLEQAETDGWRPMASPFPTSPPQKARQSLSFKKAESVVNNQNGPLSHVDEEFKNLGLIEKNFAEQFPPLDPLPKSFSQTVGNLQEIATVSVGNKDLRGGRVSGEFGQQTPIGIETESNLDTQNGNVRLTISQDLVSNAKRKPKFRLKARLNIHELNQPHYAGQNEGVYLQQEDQNSQYPGFNRDLHQNHLVDQQRFPQDKNRFPPGHNDNQNAHINKDNPPQLVQGYASIPTGARHEDSSSHKRVPEPHLDVRGNSWREADKDFRYPLDARPPSNELHKHSHIQSDEGRNFDIRGDTKQVNHQHHQHFPARLEKHQRPEGQLISPQYPSQVGLRHQNQNAIPGIGQPQWKTKVSQHHPPKSELETSQPGPLLNFRAVSLDPRWGHQTYQKIEGPGHFGEDLSPKQGKKPWVAFGHKLTPSSGNSASNYEGKRDPDNFRQQKALNFERKNPNYQYPESGGPAPLLSTSWSESNLGHFSNDLPDVPHHYDGDGDDLRDLDGDRIPGLANVDYPTLKKMPPTSFNCRGRPAGLYADGETQCQVWHVCHADGRLHSFLCPVGTIFDQRKLTCDWWHIVARPRCEGQFGGR